MNTIAQDQNTDKQLQRLAAQRYLYSRAKHVLEIQVTFDLLTPIVIAVMIAIFPSFDIYGAFVAVAVAILDVTLETYQSSRKKQAADIQEIFDCDVLILESHELKKRRRPMTETIFEAAKRYKRKDPHFSALKNWYPPIVEEIPLHLARLVCQRINCWWDSQLRRRYVQAVSTVLVILFIIVLLFSLINGLSLAKFFLAVLIPLLPTFIWTIREFLHQSEAANDKDELRKYAEELWEKTLINEYSVAKTTEESRMLQDEIYNNRRTNPFILDWFYNRLKRENEEQMNVKAEELVNEALQSKL